VIHDYLKELEGRLPRLGRGRVLAEVGGHLRESAREHGEEEALARFGPPDRVAREFRALRLRWIVALAAVALVVYPILAYPVVENSLPPAPWPEGAMPGQLEWKRDAVVALVLVALGAGLARRVTLVLAVAAPAAILNLVLGVEWAEAVPGTPAWLVAVPAGQVAIVLSAACLLARARLLASDV
jgi:hypothetical protein